MKKVNKMLVLIVIIGVLVLAIFVGKNMTEGKKIREQMDLANKYLVDLDFEQALATCDLLLEFEPGNPEIEAFVCEVYLKTVEYYQQETEYEMSMEVLELGMEKIGKNEIFLDKLDEINQLDNSYEEIGNITNNKGTRVRDNDDTKWDSMQEDNSNIKQNTVLEDNLIEIKEFVESPVIIGKSWKEVSVQDVCIFYGLGESLNRVQLNEDCYIMYSAGEQLQMRNIATDVSWYMDGMQQHNGYSFPKNIVEKGVDFSVTEGYESYIKKYKIMCLEDFLYAWKVDSANSEFVKSLIEMREGNNKQGYYNETFKSDCGECLISLQDAGNEIRMCLSYNPVSTKSNGYTSIEYSRVEIVEDEEHIHMYISFK